MSRNETNRRGFLKTAAATTVTAALGEYGSDIPNESQSCVEARAGNAAEPTLFLQS
jgi:hypothetical protein